MKTRPIIFSGPMVLALLDGRKMQTRRLIKPQPTVDGGADDYYPQWWLEWKDHEDGFTPEELAQFCPYGQPGDLLWCKEPWRTDTDLLDQLPPSKLPPSTTAIYEADADWSTNHSVGRYRHARFMPRWASRLTLELTGVRVERLQDISEGDAKAEGFSEGWMGNAIPETPIGGGLTISSPGTYASAAGHFQAYWCELHGFDAWDANLWLWVLSFRVHRCNVDELLKRRAA